MKRIFTLLALLGVGLVHAQDGPKTTGKVVYAQQIKMDVDMEGENMEMLNDMPEMKKQIEDMFKNLQNNKEMHALFFSPKQSLFKKAELEETGENQVEVDEGPIKIQMMVSNPETIVFCDKEKKETVRQEDFMDKRFLVTDKLEGMPWKLEKETKEILGYSCKKAIMIQEEDTTIAWYTMQIPVPFGPQGLGELPGLILEATFDNGSLSYVAESISFDPLPADAIVRPSNGKKVSGEKFNAIRAEKEAEMEQFEGKSGTRMEIKVH